jgi:hypothetical protein
MRNIWRWVAWRSNAGRPTERYSAPTLIQTEAQETRLAVNGGFALGNARFKTEVAAPLGRRVEAEIAGRPKGSHKRSTEPQAAV